MSRKLPFVWMMLDGALIVTLLAGPVAAQQGAAGGARALSRPRTEAADEDQEGNAGPGAGAVPGGAAPLAAVPVSPELEELLKAWELSSSKIQKLQGEHTRYVYDMVFNVEKRANGIFYYEAPDKGRIDVTPAKIAKGAAGARKDKAGAAFKLEADRAERWICTGQEVLQINDGEKSYEMYPIPPQHQGANIMEGPLPFLFGMPAEKAKKRYQLTLLQNTADRATIRAIPRTKADASQYREATIILDKTDRRYLPFAVQIIDPSGNSETVYRFDKLKVNKPLSLTELFIGEKDPFHPDLRTHKLVTAPAAIAGAQAPGGRPGAGAVPPVREASVDTVPSVVGFHYQNAEKALTAAGYTVKFVRGIPATDKKQTYVVYEQEPKARTPLDKGKPIVLTLYDKQAVDAADAPKAGIQRK